ncbi:uncharacterized protein DS421_12g368910 [Arachis hypogaea]|nr:uncharacterized protein DS421_12g368910 [Arachis hypogaea]
MTIHIWHEIEARVKYIFKGQKQAKKSANASTKVRSWSLTPKQSSAHLESIALSWRALSCSLPKKMQGNWARVQPPRLEHGYLTKEARMLCSWGELSATLKSCPTKSLSRNIDTVNSQGMLRSPHELSIALGATPMG